MSKYIFNKFRIKDKIAKAELARAHGIIILLSIAMMGLLALGTLVDLALDPWLSFAVIILLAIVVLFSLSVVLTTIKKTK